MRISTISTAKALRDVARAKAGAPARRPYVQVVPLFLRSDSGIFGYFRDHRDEIDAITGDAVHVVLPQAVLDGDAHEVAQAFQAPERYPGLKYEHLPCFWVEGSGNQSFVLRLPADQDELKRLLYRLVDAANAAQTFGDVQRPFKDQAALPAAAAPQGRRVVISLHGIRTRGAWQKDLQASFDAAEAGLQHRPFDFGFFGALALLLPPLRRRKVEWFRDRYTSVVKEERLDEHPPCIIAHSFGTYLVAQAMEQYPEIRFDRIILCGAIVRTDYPWTQRLDRGQASRVLNDHGRRDIWVRLAEWGVQDAGASGYRGFDDTAGGRVVQRQHPLWRHSDYFYRLNYDRNWVPFIAGARDPDAGEAQQRRPRNWRFEVFRLLLAAAALGAGWWAWQRWAAGRF